MNIWQYLKIFLSKHFNSLLREFKQKVFSSLAVCLILLSSIRVGQLLPDLLTNGLCSPGYIYINSLPLLKLGLNWKMDLTRLDPPPQLADIPTGGV